MVCIIYEMPLVFQYTIAYLNQYTCNMFRFDRDYLQGENASIINL
jgi:hypothetical protein